MLISDLIDELQNIKNVIGDKPVVMVENLCGDEYMRDASRVLVETDSGNDKVALIEFFRFDF